MHRQSILDPYTGLSTWKSHQRNSKGEKSLLVNSTQKAAELGFSTDGFSKRAPHGKLEPSSIQLKASRILPGIGKSPRNQLRKTSRWLAGLRGCMVLEWIPRSEQGSCERLAQFYRGDECHAGTRASHFSSRSCFWILIGCFSIPIRSLLPKSPLCCLALFLLTTLSKHNTKNYPAHLSQGCRSASRTAALGNKKLFIMSMIPGSLNDSKDMTVKLRCTRCCMHHVSTHLQLQGQLLTND